jgi:hypothetical protein
MGKWSILPPANHPNQKFEKPLDAIKGNVK